MNQITPVEQELTVNEHEEDTETAIDASGTNEPSFSRFRDMMLGPTTREYNARFRAIDRELECVHRLFEERFTDFDTKSNQKYEELHSEIHKRLREIDKQINERIDQVANKGDIDLRKLSTLMDTLAYELQEKIDKVNSTQAAQIGELRDQMRRNYDTLRNELVTETDDLDERKLNRFSLAEGLIELGMKLKDETLLDELNT